MSMHALIRFAQGAVCLFVLSLPGAAAAQTPLPDENVLWTLPAEPRAGEPLRVIAFPVILEQYYDTSNTQLNIEGSDINVVLDLQGCSPDVWCDVLVQVPVQIDLPPLEAGTYTVRVFRSADDSSPAVELPLQVAEAAATPEPMHPVEGWWWDPANPGYGLILQQRGDILGLSGFGQWRSSSWSGSWTLMTGRLDGDRFLSTLQEFVIGACLHAGCVAPYHPPSQVPSDRAAQIRFLSSREMEIEDDLGRRMRLVAMPLGGGYRSDFGSPEETSRLPLPDLRGTWVFTVDPAARETYWVESQAPLTIRFETLELDPENEAPEVDLAWRGVDPSGVEAGSREYSLICRSGTPSTCSLRYDGLQGLPPPSPLRQWRATIANIAQDRIEATWGEGDHFVRVRGFRVD